jgi:hypothetical protein
MAIGAVFTLQLETPDRADPFRIRNQRSFIQRK